MAVARGAIAGYDSPWPLIDTLPGLYQEDPLARGLTAAFDEILAPAIGSVDNFAAYLDPQITPPDFLEWLAGWVGLLPDENWPIERRRSLVAQAAELYRSRGTVPGLQMHLKLFTSGDVSIVENGGASWSATPGGKAPGSAAFSLTVRIKPAKKEPLDRARLDALIAQAKPAHVPHTVEIAES